MDLSNDPRTRTDQDWEIARSLLDENGLKQYRLSLIFNVMADAGFELNAAHCARVLEVTEKTAGDWLKILRARRK